MLRNIALITLSFLIGIGIIGIFSLLTKHVFIQTRVLQNPLGKPPFFSINQAPSRSIKGTFTTFSGPISWVSRTATTPAKLTTPISLQQGENLLTGIGGQATVAFPKVGTIALSPQSEVDFIQSLPQSFLAYQPTGSVVYTKNGPSTLSVRSMSFLIQIESGIITITADADNGQITLSSDTSSQAKIAYNNLDNVTQIVTLLPEQTLLFDDNSRTYILE